MRAAMNYCRCWLCGDWGARCICPRCHRRVHAYCGKYRTVKNYRYPNGIVVAKMRALVCNECVVKIDDERKARAAKGE